MIRYFTDEGSKLKAKGFFRTGFWMLMGFCAGCIYLQYLH